MFWPFKKNLKKVKEKYEKELFEKRGVLAVGIGHKITKGKDTGKDCICVYVRTKLPEEMLLEPEIIPKKIGGCLTDVVEIGALEPLQLEHRKRYRPCPAGVSVGHLLITAGTIGAIVSKNGNYYILTNAHVGAPHWLSENPIGNVVLQPGPADQGKNPQDIIGDVAEYIEIKDEDNLVDACLVSAEKENVIPEQFKLGKLKRPAVRPKVGDIVVKSSRTSGVNEGRVVATDVTALVNYRLKDGTKWLTKWKDQIFVNSEFIKGGDSGSLVLLKETMQPCGLVYAGSDRIGVMSQIENVQKLLGFGWIVEKEIGYLAINRNWFTDKEILVDGLNLRKEPQIADNVIRKLKKGERIGIIEYSGYQSGWHWAKVEILD